VGEVLQDLSAGKAAIEKGVSMVGIAPAFLATMERLISVAQSDCPVLLEGETGTGKELAASFLHQHSRRSEGPFLTLDCTVLTEGLFESEVFGYERGAFTGSLGRKMGLFELAGGGTLFLDEMGELPAMIQAKLLRVLETGEFRRVGGTQALHADVRVVCATNRDLVEEVKAGRFREDLYYRIAGMSVRLPSLRERTEDIPLLAQTLVERINVARQRRHRLTQAALDWLGRQEFPGNVWELRNLIRAAYTVSNRGVIDLPQLRKVAKMNGLAKGAGRCDTGADAPTRQPVEPAAPVEALAELESRHIAELLGRRGGNRRQVADALGISLRTLYRKLKKYRLNG
jgi:DNA-binding NtrC family response regulator